MFGLDYVVFRPHNVFGPRQNIGDRYRNVVGIFMNQILQGQPMTIFGDGTQTRAFSYIDDVAPLMAEAIDVAGGAQPGVQRRRGPALFAQRPGAAGRRGDGRRRRRRAPAAAARGAARARGARQDARACSATRPQTSLEDGLAADGGVGRAARRARERAVRRHRDPEEPAGGVADADDAATTPRI